MIKHVEEFDVYTIDRQKTGIIKPRGTILDAGSYRLIAHVCIFNSIGEMLIQQKSDKKDLNNIWDFSAGGSSVTGEMSRQTIQRELKEELGISYDFSSSKPNLTIYFKECIDDIYIIRDFNASSDIFMLQAEEVKGVQWASKERILEMIKNGEFTNYDRSYIELLFFMNQNGEGCVQRRND